MTMKPRRALRFVTALAVGLTAAVIAAPAGYAQPQEPDPSAETNTALTQDRLRTVYLTGTKSRKDRSRGIVSTSKVVKDWYADQGLDLRWNPKDVTVVRDTDLAKAALDSYTNTSEIPGLLTDAGVINANEIPIVYVEGKENWWRGLSCGWATIEGDSRAAILPVGNCGIYPKTNAAWPYGGTYLLAHEIGHTLGGDHVSKPRSAILYVGGKGRDWNNLRIAARNEQVMKQSPVVKNS